MTRPAPGVLAALLVAACAALAAGGTIGAAPAAEQQSCSHRGLVFPGGGPLEWKPTRKFKLRVQGFVGEPLATAGRTLVLSGVRSIAGKRRHGLAAIDMRTGRVLPFDPVIPASHLPVAVAASPTTVYVAHGTEYLGREIDAFRLSNGARLASFEPPDFRDGLVYSLAYAGGSVIIGGAQDTSTITLGAYHPTTGAPRWQQDLEWRVDEMVTDGSRLYIAIPPGSPGYKPIGAYEVKNGERIPGWGASLPARRQKVTLFGVDPSRVYGGTIHGPVMVARKNGSNSRLPQLPPRAVPASGTSRTIVGRIVIRGIFVGAVFAPSGKLVGTACSNNQVLAQVDDRHLIADQRGSSQTSSTIVELAAP